MHRFFIESSSMSGSRVVITGSDAHHIRDVLRLTIGDTICVSTGDEWEYTCEIASVAKDEVSAIVVDTTKPGRELPSKITLYQCLPKKDKFEWIIQKAVELGAYRIVPVRSARVIVSIDSKKEAARVARWNAVAAAAAKQSRRMFVPEVTGICSLKEALAAAENDDVRLIPYEKSDGMDTTRELVFGIQPGQSVSVVIGPEGGFEEQEIEMARQHGFEPISLGKRILRTETAGMSMLSVLGFMLDDKG